MEVDMSPEEYKEHLQSLAEKRDRLDEEIDEEVEELSSLLFERNPLSVISNLWLRNSITNPETYKEHEHDRTNAFTEYIATFYLTDTFDLGKKRGLEPLSPQAIDEIQTHAEQLFTYTLLQNGLRDVDPSDAQPPGAFDELRFQYLNQNTAVRYGAYEPHTETTLRGILNPLDDLLRENLGFTAEHAIDLSKAVQDLSEERLFDILERAHDSREEWNTAIEQFKNDGVIPEKFPRDMIEYGASLNPKQLQEWTIRISSTWAATFLGYELLFTTEDLAENAGVSVGQTRSFLNRMSLCFGEVNPQWYRQPSATPPLQLRPIVRLRPAENPLGDHETFFCPVPQSILWSLRNNVEAALNPEGSDELASLRLPSASNETWNRYEESRSSYTEHRTIQLLSELLPTENAFQNLKYQAPDRQGNINQTELDGLILLDDTLFLIEAKAGSLTPPARRGAPSLEEELDEIIRKGHAQALRARSYIESRDTPTFRKEDGSVVTVPHEEISRTFLIVVSLEGLSVFGTNLHDLDRAGLLENDDWPWCVSLTDLEVVSELLDSPTEFIHFLKNRLDVASEGKIMAVDELDWLGCYLEGGLNFKTDDLGDDIGWMMLQPTFTSQIDDYYLYEYGPREKEAPKPSQPLPTPLREIISEIEERKPSGFYRMTEVILDFPHHVREEMADRMYDAREQAVSKGIRSGASFPNPMENDGVTYLVLPSGSEVEELQEKLDAFCTLRKYQMRADRWIALGYIVDGSSRWIHYSVFNDEPWEHDPELEEASEKLSSPSSLEVSNN